MTSQKVFVIFLFCLWHFMIQYQPKNRKLRGLTSILTIAKLQEYQVSILDRFRSCSRDSQGGSTKTAWVFSEKTKLSNAATESRACKLCSLKLHCLIWFSRLCLRLFLFFRLMSPLNKNETRRGCSPVYFCSVVIVNILIDLSCFLVFAFSFESK